MPKRIEWTRREKFIDQKGGNAFMPLSHMIQIRRDEAVIRSKAKRNGETVDSFHHVHFHCPSGCCLGTPIPNLKK